MLHKKDKSIKCWQKLQNFQRPLNNKSNVINPVVYTWRLMCQLKDGEIIQRLDLLAPFQVDLFSKHTIDCHNHASIY